jgi:hypothetical protein
MTRQQFHRFRLTREPCRVVMEGCSSACSYASASGFRSRIASTRSSDRGSGGWCSR